MNKKHKGIAPKNKILVNDRIADNLLQQIILKPESYDVILAPNVDGDYISDEAGALVGNVGVLGSMNVGDSTAIFEPVHGTAPKYTGMNIADPIGAIRAGTMMLDYLELSRASKVIETAITNALKLKKATGDLAAHLGAKPLGTSEFADAVIASME